MDQEKLKSLIHDAFADVEYPGDHCLINSRESEEPLLLEKEFKGKNDWRCLDSHFLEQAPDNYSTALCFFSDEAFRFYLPAYLIADIAGQLQNTDPVFHLCHGFHGETKYALINPRRYGSRTAYDYACFKFSTFTKAQVNAVVAYLTFKADCDEFERPMIQEAIACFWQSKNK